MLKIPTPNLQWTPLKQPFIPFISQPLSIPVSISNQKQKRPNSSESYRSELANNVWRIQGDFSEDRASCWQGKELGEMLENSRRVSKELLEEDVANLRQQIWLKIQTTFRKVHEHSDNLHQSLLPIPPFPSHPSSATPTKTVPKQLKKFFQNNQCLYNRQRMLRVSEKIVEKVGLFLEEIVGKCLGDLYFIGRRRSGGGGGMDEGGVGDGDGVVGGRSGESYRKSQSRHHQYKLKSMSLHKYNKQPQSNLSKQKQFQQLFNKIKYKKEIDKKLKSESPSVNPYLKINRDIHKIQNPYGLNIQTGKFFQQTQSAHQFNNTYFSHKSSRPSASRAIRSASKPNSTLKSHQLNLNPNLNPNISISPIISRLILPQPSSTSYTVSPNQQSLSCQWCQQIKLSPDIRKIAIGRSGGSWVEKVGDSETAVCVCFCNGFGNVAVGCRSSFIYVYEMEGEEERERDWGGAGCRLVAKLEGHSAAVCCLCEGMGLLFSGGDIGCSSIFIWDMSTWTVRSKLNYHTAAITSIYPLPNTTYILSSSLDKSLKLYNHSSSLLTYSHKSPKTSYLKLLYYQQQQIVAVMTPSINIQMFGVEMGSEDWVLIQRKGICCGGRVTGMERGVGERGVVVVGVETGAVEVYGVGGELVKRVEIGVGPVIGMVTFNRSSKPQLPLILYACPGSVVFYTINTANEFATQLNVKGNLDFVVGSGVNPIMVINDRFQLAWVNQRQNNAQLHLTKFQIH